MGLKNWFFHELLRLILLNSIAIFDASEVEILQTRPKFAYHRTRSFGVNDVGVTALELISKIIQSRLTDYLEFRLSDTTWCLLERIAHRGYGKYVCLPNRRFLICKCKRSAAKVQPTCALFSYRLRTIALVAMATTCAEWDSHWNSNFWLGRYRTGCRRCCYKYVILTNWRTVQHHCDQLEPVAGRIVHW